MATSALEYHIKAALINDPENFGSFLRNLKGDDPEVQQRVNLAFQRVFHQMKKAGTLPPTIEDRLTRSPLERHIRRAFVSEGEDFGAFLTNLKGDKPGVHQTVDRKLHKVVSEALQRYVTFSTDSDEPTLPITMMNHLHQAIKTGHLNPKKLSGTNNPVIQQLLQTLTSLSDEPQMMQTDSVAGIGWDEKETHTPLAPIKEESKGE